jgi:hypothetical protein
MDRGDWDDPYDLDPDECIYLFTDEFGERICGRCEEECLGADCDFIEVERRCRICGCTDSDCRQCIEKTGEPCHWVEPDLCSTCAREAYKDK